MSEVQNETTNITDLPPAERALIVLGAVKTEEHLKELVDRAKEITEVKDKATRDMAHRVAMDLRSARTTIEKAGKAARDDANAFNKAVLDTEKRLKAITADEEDRIFSLRDAFDTKEKAEKEAKERAEAERVAAIKSQIEAFKRLPLESAQDGAEDLQATIDDLSQLAVTEDVYAEFTEEAAKTLADVILQLRGMLDTAVRKAEADAAVAAERQRLEDERAAFEAEKAQLAAEREELSRLRAAAAVAAAPTSMVVGETVSTGDLLKFDAPVEHATEIISVSHAGLERIGGTPLDTKIDGDTVIVGDDLSTDESVGPVDQSMFEADNDDGTDADAIVPQLARYTAMQFHALGRKVAAAGAGAYAVELRSIGDRLLAGEFDEAILAADWTAMGEADKEIALASQACVTLVYGDAGGFSALLDAEQQLQAAE